MINHIHECSDTDIHDEQQVPTDAHPGLSSEVKTPDDDSTIVFYGCKHFRPGTERRNPLNKRSRSKR